MNNNNLDMAKLMDMLSKMDKQQLQNGIEQATKIMNCKDKDMINNIFNNTNKDNK